MKKPVFIAIIGLFSFACLKGQAHAAALANFSDLITTSRPSAATPLTANVGSSDTQAQITSEDASSPNYSIFIASDSARFLADSGETEDTVNVASMSGADKPSSGSRIVYFTGTIGHTHHLGDTVIVPITAEHKIQFTPQTSIPSGGKIIITFPGSGTNTASPSATGFSFNGLTSSDISYQMAGGGVICGTLNVSAPTITCTTSGGSISAGTVVTFLIGCGDASTNENSCSSHRPRLINPTKSTSNVQSGASAATVADDNWRVNVQTQDTVANGSTVLDQSTTTVGIIESVQVQASVDPTLTFTITGIASGVDLSSGHGSGCVDTTNSGITTTGTFVNLGLLTATKINLAAQDLSVATNEAAGYALTATSSGHLLDPASGYAISDPGTTPATMTVGTESFGIQPCGTDANSSFTPTSGLCTTSACTTAGSGKIAWPTTTSSVTLASRNSITSGVVTTIQYASTVSGTTPAGTYNTVVTYVATPTFN